MPLILSQGCLLSTMILKPLWGVALLRTLAALFADRHSKDAQSKAAAALADALRWLAFELLLILVELFGLARWLFGLARRHPKPAAVAAVFVVLFGLAFVHFFGTGQEAAPPGLVHLERNKQTNKQTNKQ